MAGTGMQRWSQTAGSNATADSAVNWAEGQAPSSVNDSARAMMASGAKWRDDNNGTIITTGSSAAFSAATSQVSTGNVDGYTVTLQFHATTDASATYAQDGNAAAKLQLVSGTNLSGGEIPAGAQRRLRYSSSSTAWIIEGERSLIASDVSAGFVTGTMMADTTIASTKLIDSTIATTKIADSAITYAKFQNVAASSIVANLSTSAAAPTSYTLGNNLVKSGTSIDTAYGPKAWVTFTVSAGTVTISASFNVASVVRNAQGEYTITFTNNMTDNNYAVCGAGQNISTAGNNIFMSIDKDTNPSASAVKVHYDNGGGISSDPVRAGVIIFGN